MPLKCFSFSTLKNNKRSHQFRVHIRNHMIFLVSVRVCHFCLEDCRNDDCYWNVHLTDRNLPNWRVCDTMLALALPVQPTQPGRMRFYDCIGYGLIIASIPYKLVLDAMTFFNDKTLSSLL